MSYPNSGNGLDNMPFIQTDLDDGVLAITLNRPQARHAIDVAMALRLGALFDTVQNDAAVRVVVLRGAGEGFCSGFDAPDFHDANRHGEAVLRAARDIADNWRVRQLRLLPQPVIAQVHGYCEGGAIAILEACDIVLAADDAQFTLSDDILADKALAKAVSATMLPRAASYYALTGESFDGREAERNGLATASFPEADLQRETRSLARELASKDRAVLGFTKETLLHAPHMTWDGVLSFTAAKFSELKLMQSGRQSVRASSVDRFLSGKSKPGLGG